MSGRINLAALKSFCAIAETDTMREAGEQAGKSFAMTSKQVTELEGSLGVKLFNRYRSQEQGRLTEAGELVYRTGKKIFGELANLEKEITRFNPDVHDKRVFWL